MWRSFAYLARDLALCAALAYAASLIGNVPSALLRGALWCAYIVAQVRVCRKQKKKQKRKKKKAKRDSAAGRRARRRRASG